MCFFTQPLAVAVARRLYGRKTNIVDAALKVLAERETIEREKQRLDPSHKIDIYAIRLTEGMMVSPAYSEPFQIIISESDEIQVMQWGLIPRGSTAEKREYYRKKNLYKNARAERLFDTWPWKFLTRKRCIIPVQGFYEPHQFPDGRKQYYYIHQREDEGISIAGLWDEWTDSGTGEKLKTFVMITVAANEKLRWVHNTGNNPFRMPLIIPNDKVEQWLDPEMTEPNEIEMFLVTPPDDDIVVWPVRLKFNYGDPYDPSITDKVPPLQQEFDFP